MDKRAQTCCFTGHRHLPAGEEESIWRRVQEHLIPLLEQGSAISGWAAHWGLIRWSLKNCWNCVGSIRKFG